MGENGERIVHFVIKAPNFAHVLLGWYWLIIDMDPPPKFQNGCQIQNGRQDGCQVPTETVFLNMKQNLINNFDTCWRNTFKSMILNIFQTKWLYCIVFLSNHGFQNGRQSGKNHKLRVKSYFVSSCMVLNNAILLMN